MRETIFFFLFYLLAAFEGTCQKIEYEKTPQGYLYTFEGESISYNQVEKLVVKDEDAITYWKNHLTTKRWGRFLGFVGGGLVAWPIGSLVAGGTLNWTLAAIGAGVVLVIAIPLIVRSNQLMTMSLDVYNREETDGHANTGRLNLSLAFTTSGIGMVITF